MARHRPWGGDVSDAFLRIEKAPGFRHGATLCLAVGETAVKTAG